MVTNYTARRRAGGRGWQPLDGRRLPRQLLPSPLYPFYECRPLGAAGIWRAQGQEPLMFGRECARALARITNASRSFQPRSRMEDNYDDFWEAASCRCSKPGLSSGQTWASSVRWSMALSPRILCVQTLMARMQIHGCRRLKRSRVPRSSPLR